MTTAQTQAPTPLDVVQANLASMAVGDRAAIRARWADDAVHHITGTSAFAGALSADRYLGELLPAFYEMVPDYRSEVVSVTTCGELVCVHWKSWGTLPDSGELSPVGGLLVYRVVDGLVAESWAFSGCAELPF